MNTNRIAGLAAVLALGLVLGGGATYFWSSRSDASSLLAKAGDPHAGGPGHDEHSHGNSESQDEQGGEYDGGLIKLSAAELREFGIEVRIAGGGRIASVLTLPGEIRLNADQVAHIVPRVAGIVKRVDKRLGDEVALGEVMAVLESRELAEAKAGYLAALQRLALAEATFTSSESLKDKGIMPELDFLAIRKERDEAQIEVRTAEYKLRALGLTDEEIAEIPQEADSTFSRYELRAPFSGTVIEKHMALGELVTSESDVFALADLSDVWVHLTVYQKDLSAVRVGQSVAISAGDEAVEARGTIEYVSPVVAESTRTATARVVLPNPRQQWRPGVFITGRVNVKTSAVRVLVPRTALVTVDEREAVFVETEHGFELRTVTVGRSDNTNVEVADGLVAGERYVAVGAFSFKAELGKAAFAGDGHHH